MTTTASIDFLGQPQERARVTREHPLPLRTFLQALPSKLADPGLHREARSALRLNVCAQHALLRQRRDPQQEVSLYLAHLLRRLEGKPALEDAQLREEFLRWFFEQFVTPRDRVVEPLMASRYVAEPATQIGEPDAQSVKEHLGRQHSDHRRSQFDRQGKPVQLTADLHHRSR